MSKKKTKNKNTVVLVGVLRSWRDRDILLREKWYRIPLARMPVRPFKYIAFYEPAIFGCEGKCIRYYAKIRTHETALRRELFSDESHHPRANERYVKFIVGPIQKLGHSIQNSGSPRRISFGFTTLQRLRSSRNILQLFRVPPTEEVMQNALRREGIPAIPQYRIVEGKRHFRLDFAILCRRGGIAVECDNKKAHSGKSAKKRDIAKDKFLKKKGWVVLRFSELAVQYFKPECIKKIKQVIRAKGGVENGIIRSEPSSKNSIVFREAKNAEYYRVSVIRKDRKNKR